jgi:hypothetical protein
MALSVMGDAPVFDEGCEPLISRQDAPARYRVAVPPAAANYRASGLVLWHLTDVTIVVMNVRF